MKVKVVQDLVCPWCYIGHHNLDAAIREQTAAGMDNIEVEWLPYQLDPLEPGAPQQGFTERFQERKGIGPDQMRGMFDRVTEVGASVGIAFRFDRITVAVDTLPGHIAIAAAPPARQGSFVNALHRAYFEEGKDIGAPAEIEAAARVADLSDDEIKAVRAALDDPRARADVQATIRAVQEAGVTGVPYFVIDDAIGLSGGQPVEVFRRAFAQVTDPAVV
jgi:predicted DsbA family dithiol-disulfide isomerase